MALKIWDMVILMDLKIMQVLVFNMVDMEGQEEKMLYYADAI